MVKEDCFYLGKITKKFSFKGEVLIYLDTDQPENYLNMESVFVEFNNNLIPYFIKSSSFHKNDFLRVRFDDVEDELTADIIIGCNIYLPLTMLPILVGNKFYFHEVIGFEITEKNFGFLGKIQSVNDDSSQALFEVLNGDLKLLIPIVDKFIIQIDRVHKKIIMDLPQSLINFLR